MDIKIYNKNVDLSVSLKEYLEDKFGALDKYQMDILGFHVDLIRDEHHKKGEVYTVEVHMNLPNKNNITMKEIQHDVYAAIDILQTKLARQLVKYKEKGKAKIRKRDKVMRSLKFWRKNKEY